MKQHKSINQHSTGQTPQTVKITNQMNNTNSINKYQSTRSQGAYNYRTLSPVQYKTTSSTQVHSQIRNTNHAQTPLYANKVQYRGQSTLIPIKTAHTNQPKILLSPIRKTENSKSVHPVNERIHSPQVQNQHAKIQIQNNSPSIVKPNSMLTSFLNKKYANKQIYSANQRHIGNTQNNPASANQ